MGNVFTAGAIRGEYGHKRQARHRRWRRCRVVHQHSNAGATPPAWVSSKSAAGSATSDCAATMIQDLKRGHPVGLLAQVCDAVTSYGGTAGRSPTKKSRAKLAPDTPKYSQSDATIVAPLIFGYVRGLPSYFIFLRPAGRREVADLRRIFLFATERNKSVFIAALAAAL